MARINVPDNSDDFLKLAEDIYAKHQELGASSPLKDLDWSASGPAIEEAKTHDEEAKKLRRKAEAELELRNGLLPGLKKIVRQSRDLLLALNPDNPRKLGEFGFSVDDSPR